MSLKRLKKYVNLIVKKYKSFSRNRVNEADFGSTTGYGYGDIGREKIEKVFCDVLKA